ncbi:MAG TPA: DUF1003 domain-containing protein [Pseudonocardiaceae bacterium]|nr:DUF1003 domain-containing protein [Pseudonocardiaceae bacterium]
MSRPLWHLHPHVRSGDQLLFRERAADVLKRAFGTWSILGIVALIIAVWIVTGGLGTDPMPFILLNLCLSCLAAVQGIILQIAANRGDRQASELALSNHANGEQLLAMNKQQLEILTELRELRALLGTQGGAQS